MLGLQTTYTSPGNSGVAVVRELVQCVEDRQLRVRGGEEGQGQWDSSADYRLPIVQLGGGERRGAKQMCMCVWREIPRLGFTSWL